MRSHKRAQKWFLAQKISVHRSSPLVQSNDYRPPAQVKKLYFTLQEWWMIGAGNIVHPSTIISVRKVEFSCLLPLEDRAKFRMCERWRIVARTYGQSYVLHSVEISCFTHISCITLATKFMQFPTCLLWFLDNPACCTFCRKITCYTRFLYHLSY